MNTQNWYLNLLKPDWAPPAWLFGPVWSVLYVIIAVSYGYVVLQGYRGQISSWLLVPLGLNLFFNALFSPIQFELQSNWLATIDIVLVWLTLVWFMVAIWPYVRWVALVNIPYFVWVTFAAVLQISITFLN